MVEIQFVVGIAVFVCTFIAYATLFVLGHKWRKRFKAKEVKYWVTSKEKRVAELTREIWRPKLVMLLYSLAYFTNGYNRITFSVWIPLYLLQVRGFSIIDVALFVSLIYVSWGWKMFLGILMDALPIKIRGQSYRRLPWFVVTGTLYMLSTLIFLLSDPADMPVWTLFFPTLIIVTTAGALFDISADSYAIDATPPELHGRVLGAASRMGRALGGVFASVLPPLLIGIGGYRLAFISATLTGAFAFLSLTLKEPTLTQERIFSRKAIAFTFPEKAVLVGSLTMLLFAFSLTPVASSLGGMFALIVKEVVGISPNLVGNISLVTLLCGIPGSIIAGFAADKWGHKRLFVVSGILWSISGLLWINLRENMVVWFVVSAMLISFLYSFNLTCLLALMGDITPLALSSTIFQMYMSFIWIGNVPMSILVGLLITINLPLCIVLMSFFTIVMVIVGRSITPYDVGKAVKT